MTKSSQPVSVGFISLGCAKNLVDSQTMAGELLARDMVLAHRPEEADIVIVNTCAFIESAREESVEAILSACELKRDGRCRAVLVAGCMPQRYRDEIQEALPDVDGFIGLDMLDRVAEVAASLMEGERGIVEIPEGSQRLFEPRRQVVFSTGRFAYLKIAEGCNHRCAFCAIPGIRGAHRSRSIDALVREARGLLDAGFRELALISQDVMYYGRDLGKERDADLSSLLRALGGLDDGSSLWIRLLYGYPSAMSDELLETMSSIPSVVPYLDVPIQHSHPDILNAMRRGETIEAVASMAKRARRVMPSIALRTTCLVGFPGETEAHFEHLMTFVRETEFDHLGAFVYSPEEGTPAYSMNDVPEKELATERRDRLLLAQQEIVDRKAKQLLGTRDRFLVEAPTGEKDLWRGRSSRQAPEVDGITYLTGLSGKDSAGTFVEGVYTEQADYDMVANVD